MTFSFALILIYFQVLKPFLVRIQELRYVLGVGTEK